MSRTRIRTILLSLILSVLGLGVGVARADGPRVVIEPPIFLPQTDFPYENGYYRTNEGHYYHYDRDRNGWHYGRNHEEGIRYEHEHEGRHREHHR